MNLSRARLESVLLVVLAAALGALLLATEGSVSTEERLSRQNHLFTAFRPQEIQEIELRSEYDDEGKERKSHIALSRGAIGDAHEYFIGSKSGPEAVEADRAAIVDLLSTLEFATWLRTIEPGSVPEAQLGFSHPRFIASIDMGSLSYRLVAGKEAPAPSGSVYARVTQGGAHVQTGVVSQSFIEKLASDVQRFRGRLLLPHGRSKTKALSIVQGKEQLELTKDDVGFMLSGGSRVDRDASDQLFFQMARAGLEVYLSEAQMKALLASNTAATEARQEGGHTLRIVQRPDAGKEVEVVLGGRCPGHPDLTLARRLRPDILGGCVPTSAVQGIEASLSGLSDRTLFPLHPDEIDHVIVERAGETLDLIRKDSAFELVSPRRQPVALDTGNEFIETLATTKGQLIKGEQRERVLEDATVLGTITAVGSPIDADESVRLTAELLRTPQAQVESASNEQAVEGSAMRSFEERLLIRRLDDDQVLRLPDAVGWALDPDSPWYRPKQLLDREAKDIVRAEIVADGKREVIAVRAGQLELVVPESRKHDDRLTRDLRKLLAGLKAERWLVPDPGRPRAPRIEVTFELSEESENEQPESPSQEDETAQSRQRHTLTVGKRVEGGYAAWSSLSEHAFVLPPSAVTTLETSLIDREPALFHPGSIRNLSIRWGSLHYELSRQGESLVVDNVRAPHLGPAIEQTLSGLLPLASVRGGDATKTAGDQLVEPLVLSGTFESPSGEDVPFRFSYGRVTVYQGEVAQLVEVDGAGAYFVRRGPVLELQELL